MEKQTKKNNETGLIVAETPVADILAKIEKEIKKYKNITDTPWITKGDVTGFSTNIRNETLIANLIRMGSSLEIRKEAYDKFAKKANLETYPVFEDNGFQIDAIEKDIILRIDMINQKDTIDTLQGFKKEVTGFLTEEEKKADFMNRLSQYLNKE